MNKTFISQNITTFEQKFKLEVNFVHNTAKSFTLGSSGESSTIRVDYGVVPYYLTWTGGVVCTLFPYSNIQEGKFILDSSRSVTKCSIDLHGIGSCSGPLSSGSVLIYFYKQLYGKDEFESTVALSKSAYLSSGSLSLTLTSTDLSKLNDLSGVKIKFDLSNINIPS